MSLSILGFYIFGNDGPVQRFGYFPIESLKNYYKKVKKKLDNLNKIMWSIGDIPKLHWMLSFSNNRVGKT